MSEFEQQTLSTTDTIQRERESSEIERESSESSSTSTAPTTGTGTDTEGRAGHGVGDRKEYYNKWDNFAKKSEEEIEKEEKEMKRKDEEASKNIPLSEAEKKDREKREALKEAKKHWDGVTADQNSKKVIISNEVNINQKIFHFENDFLSRRVLILKDNTDCSYAIPQDIHLVKIFIEGCKRCSLTLHCNIATSNIEISRCEDFSLFVQTHPIHTIQVDISERVTINYASGLFSSQSRVYHSAVHAIRIEYLSHHQELDDYELSQQCSTLLQSDELQNSSGYTHHFGTAHLSSNQKQFMTTYNGEDLVTDLVLRDSGGHVTTIREIEERKRAVETAAREKGLDINSPEVQKILHEYDPPSPQDQGLKLKEKGNAAFKENDYAQASVFYTQAIEILENLVNENDSNINPSITAECRDVLCTVYSNRAACALKLGDHQQALIDTNACLDLDPENVKANFRKGLALHAMGRYREACPVLGFALKKEPKNQQIKEPLLFAERKASLPNSR